MKPKLLLLFFKWNTAQLKWIYFNIFKFFMITRTLWNVLPFWLFSPCARKSPVYQIVPCLGHRTPNEFRPMIADLIPSWHSNSRLTLFSFLVLNLTELKLFFSFNCLSICQKIVYSFNLSCYKILSKWSLERWNKNINIMDLWYLKKE